MADLRVRRSVIDAMKYDAPLDALGRRQPRKISAFSFLRAIPGLYGQFRTIPPEFWTLDAGPGGVSRAVIACPCGCEPCLDVGELHGCPCERYFLFVGEAVLVANSPMVRPPASPIDASEVGEPPAEDDGLAPN